MFTERTNLKIVKLELDSEEQAGNNKVKTKQTTIRLHRKLLCCTFHKKQD